MSNTPRKSKKQKATAGLAPGTLTYVGDEKTSKVDITVIDYDGADLLEEKTIEDVRNCYDYKEKDSITWINIDGIHDTRIVKTLGMYFNLHPLLMEDIVNTHQRPKVEFYEDNIFVVMKMLNYQKDIKHVEVEQVSLILGKNYVLSFQEDIEGDAFENIRERLRKKPNGKVRNSDSAYLFYLLMDAIVDNYMVVIEGIGEELEELEDKIIHETAGDPTKALHKYKRQLTFVRKSIRPVREIVNNLIREEDHSGQFLKSVHFYLRDLYDHSIQVLDNTDSFVDMNSNLLDTYLSMLSNKTNDVMKVLTIFSTIFMPLTFIVGVYGMNFDVMPEVHTKYGYYIIWIVMICTATILFYYFRRKRWL
ncbi:MAG TPA: magnesium and cobalt transport protein CorA [Microscillaceae bacterium]|nr:magnesium and cobalt transport protein CorA [Microscillaceae bacterium]